MSVGRKQHVLSDRSTLTSDGGLWTGYSGNNLSSVWVKIKKMTVSIE